MKRKTQFSRHKRPIGTINGVGRDHSGAKSRIKRWKNGITSWSRESGERVSEREERRYENLHLRFPWRKSKSLSALVALGPDGTHCVRKVAAVAVKLYPLLIFMYAKELLHPQPSHGHGQSVFTPITVIYDRAILHTSFLWAQAEKEAERGERNREERTEAELNKQNGKAQWIVTN